MGKMSRQTIFLPESKRRNGYPEPTISASLIPDRLLKNPETPEKSQVPTRG